MTLSDLLLYICHVCVFVVVLLLPWCITWDHHTTYVTVAMRLLFIDAVLVSDATGLKAFVSSVHRVFPKRDHQHVVGRCETILCVLLALQWFSPWILFLIVQ